MSPSRSTPITSPIRGLSSLRMPRVSRRSSHPISITDLRYALNSENDDDEFIVAENYRVDIDEIALSDLLLELPTKLLCKDDCKGLCPVCGCDLNESECNCQKY